METLKQQSEPDEMSTYLLRVERSYRTLLQFKEQLKSYLCEPCTVVQYETKERIQTNIDRLAKGHLALLDIYRNKKNNLNSLVQTITDQLKEAKTLEEGISNYITLVQR